jgi:hypothetical protein
MTSQQLQHRRVPLSSNKHLKDLEIWLEESPAPDKLKKVQEIVAAKLIKAVLSAALLLQPEREVC